MKGMRCQYIDVWICYVTDRDMISSKKPSFSECDLCLRARQQWIVVDSYTKQNEHYEDGYLDKIDKIVEAKVRIAFEKLSGHQN